MLKNKISAAKTAVRNNKDELIVLGVAAATLVASHFVIVKLTDVPNPYLESLED